MCTLQEQDFKTFFPQGSFHQNRPDLLQMALSLCAPTHMAVKLYSPAEY